MLKSSIVEERKNNSNGVIVAHLNINRIQNKFEEPKLLNDSLKAHAQLYLKPKLIVHIQTVNSVCTDIKCIEEIEEKGEAD